MELMEQIASPENLLAAWRAVRGNIPRRRRDMPSGVDGLSLTEFERDLPAQLSALQDMLVKERYQPQPPKVFEIKKKSGGRRKLAVLTVRDRLAQRAAQQVLEPLWEEEFLTCSFGFRPGCSTIQAALYVQQQRQAGMGWLVDGDIANCFESLDHDLLEAQVRRKVNDGRVTRLLQLWLDNGSIQAGLPADPNGIEQQTPAVQKLLQEGLRWIMDPAGGEDDPYAADRYENDAGGDAARGSDEIQTRVNQSTLRRLALEGLAMGAAWVQPGLAKAGEAAKLTLGTPAGRRLLQKGVLLSGGLAGAAAAAALAAFLINRKVGPAPVGVLQGSPLSPLLANIYLHPFDRQLTRRKYSLARYADDWVICCANQAAAEAAYNDAVRVLAHLHLKVNTEKTRIVAPGETLEWLGIVVK